MRFKIKIFFLGLIFISYAILAAAQTVVNEGAERDLTAATNPLKEDQLFSSQPRRQSTIENEERQKKSVPAGPSVLVKKIIVRGNTIFSIGQLREVLPPSQKMLTYESTQEYADQASNDQLLDAMEGSRPQGRMMTFQELQDFADRVTAYYQSHGYAIDYAYIPLQKVLNGVVTINVLEVRVGKISVTGNRWFSAQSFLDVMSLKTGDFFKMQDLENSLNQMNAQPDRFVKAYLEPGKDPATTDITLKVAEQLPFHASYEYNTRGTDVTGRYRNVLHLTDNNLTGHNDIVDAALETAEKNALYAEALHYELPVAGRDVVHADFSNARSKLQGDLLPYDVRGNAISFIPGYTHNFIHTGTMKLDGDLRFEIKDSKTDLEGSKLSFDRTRAFVGGPRITLDDEKGRTTAGLDVHVGIPNFMGSLPNSSPLASRPNSGGGFIYETLNASRVQKLPMGMSLVGQANGQYSSHPLTSLEQMYLGGMYSVRGYPENDSAGDSGFSFSQELHVPFYCIPPDWKVWGMPDKRWRDTLSLVGFVDEGKVFDAERPQAGGAQDRLLLGAGPGVRFYISPDFNMQFDMGFPFGDTPSDKRNVQPHLSARVGF